MRGLQTDLLFARLRRPVAIAPLLSFRIIFGLLMAGSLLRFWWRGWVTAVYVTPVFHFRYTGFDWVRPLGDTGMHILFASLILAALLIALGLFYRLSAIVFFLGFTYVELLDATTYLNHYYFISLVAFLMIWLPANRQFALDALIWPGLRRSEIPAWCIGILRFQLGLVYCFAGLAKLNADWLLDAQPLRTWLPAKSHLPVVGPLMGKLWVAYLFSWFGAFYDLFIPFFLLRARTRPVAYFFVLAFHIATAVFFPGIGLFPYVMIACSLIFFSAAAHERVLGLLPGYSSGRFRGWSADPVYRYRAPRLITAGVIVFCLAQLLVPLRFLLYPGHLFWHEEGYRFSWRVMLMEKSGAAYFRVRDSATQQSVDVNNAAFLTPLQEKMMSTQPDLILKYAHHLAAVYKARGMRDPAVYAEVWVALNGQRSRPFTDTAVNLAAVRNGWQHYQWILPYSVPKRSE